MFCTTYTHTQTHRFSRSHPDACRHPSHSHSEHTLRTIGPPFQRHSAPTKGCAHTHTHTLNTICRAHTHTHTLISMYERALHGEMYTRAQRKPNNRPMLRMLMMNGWVDGGAANRTSRGKRAPGTCMCVCVCVRARVRQFRVRGPGRETRETNEGGGEGN